MRVYVTLYKLTDQGARDIKAAPQRIEAGIQAWEAAGGKLIAFYVLEGDYDYVSVTEAPDNVVTTAFLQAVQAQGNVRVTAMRAHSREEYSEMIGKASEIELENP